MISDKWISVNLSEICNIRRGASPRPIQDFIGESGMPWVKIADATATNSRYLTKTKEFIKLDGVKSSVVVSPGTLILSNSATPGMPKFMGIEACVHDGWLIIRDFKKVMPMFLYYQFLYIRTHLVNNANGSVFQNLKTDIVKDFTINLPPIVEQKRIVEVLSCLDEKNELNNRINKNLEEMAQAIFKSWFIDFEPFQDGEFEDSKLGRIPKGWNIGIVNDFFNISIGKTPPRKEPKWFSNNSDDVKWLSIADIGKDGMFSLNTKEYLTKEAVKKHNVKIIPRDTVIVSFKLTVGRVAITNDAMVTNEAIAHFKPVVEDAREFTYLYLKQFNFDSLGNTSSIGTAVNSKTIKTMPFFVPEALVLKRFSETVNGLFERIRLNQEQTEILISLRDVLLPKLMSGEIRLLIEEV